MYGFFDGELKKFDEIKVPVTDRAFLCGDGVFTTLKVSEGQPFFFQKHKERLERHCQALHIAPPKIHQEDLHRLIDANNAHKGIYRLRIYITGGSGTHVDMTPRSHGHILMMLTPYESHMKPPLTLKTYPYPMTRSNAYVKSMAYLDRYWIKEFSRQEKCDEALVLSPEGWILEGAYANIFWRLGQEIYTPDPMLPIIHGITISVITETLKAKGMTIHYVREKIEEIPGDAEVYLCNSLIDFLPVERINERMFPLNPDFASQNLL